MQFTVRHAFAMSPDDFWSKLFFDDDFNARLFEEALGFDKYEIIERIESTSGDLVRTARIVPHLDYPAPLRRLLGERVWYFEKGYFDASTSTWRTLLEVPALGDKFDVRTTMHLEPRGAGSDRVIAVTIDARIFGVGKLLVSFMERSMRDSYGKVADFTNAWWAEHHAPASDQSTPMETH